MLRGTGTAHTRVGAHAAFTYLADPRHAPEWFATVVVEAMESGPLRPGQTWRFVQRRDGGKPGDRPIRMAQYEPPHRFIWETLLPRAGTNLAWEMVCEPESAGGTTLQMTVRWRPGPLGWLAVLAASITMRGVLPERAQRTAERARDAVEAAYPASGGLAARADDGRPNPRSDARRRRRG